MQIINIEQGHPTVQQAMVKLQNGIYRARASGQPFAKIVHGYGSSGTGGAIKQAIGLELRKYVARGMIKSYCPGEDFGPSVHDIRACLSGSRRQRQGHG